MTLPSLHSSENTKENWNVLAEQTEVVSVREVSYTGKYFALDSPFYNQQERKDAVKSVKNME